MPDVPLPDEVLLHAGGVINTALDDYYAERSEANLLRVLEPFKAATEGYGLLCWQMNPWPCFNARRWMASLGAQHYMRLGPQVSVPVEVAQVWWDVGVSGIAVQYLSWSGSRIGASWMYLAYSFAPEAFREPSAYMGNFLRRFDLHRVSLFVALRRMVGDGPAHLENPVQVLEDGYFAVQRADAEVGAGVTEFVFSHMVDRLEQGRRPDLDLEQARTFVMDAWFSGRQWLQQGSAEWARTLALRDRALDLLE